MATSPYRSTVTIDGTKFDALSTSVAFSTLKDRAGNPEMGSLRTDIRVYVDFHDDGNVPYSTLSKLFTMANVVTKDKIKDIKIEYWKDETKQDALASYSFKGWISRFETQNPMASSAVGSNGGTDLTSYSTVNHLLVLDIEPALDSNNFANVSMSN
jgi:hypothetical protein